ncbi:unnamed protein product [Soboliphyme baturini]|uniref:Pre-mRNA-processing factor 19 n=1 Tax=Soboliphyme baturini TaxID=241478 RepID=A0A3P8ER84_9BILA|nr:unnamed protein product [Soboliphyme baturini]
MATLKPHAAFVPNNVQEPHYGAEAGEGAEQPAEEVGMSNEVIKKLQDKAAVLTASRKQRGRSMPEGLTKPDELKSFKQASQFMGLHSASIPGITCLDVHMADTNLILTGGNDKNAVVFNKQSEQVVAVFKGHQKKIMGLIYHPTEADICITGSADKTIRIWSVSSQSCRHILRVHDGPVTGVSLHATGDYVLSVSSDEKWAFSDVHLGRVLCRVTSPSSGGMTSAQFHPDGLIFGVGTADANVKIWDLKEKTNVANFPGHMGAIRSIAFSENGYYLATAAADSMVKLWDLRKLKNFRTITLDDKFEVNDLYFDQSGSYLAVAGSDVRVYQCKSWQELCVLTDHTDLATGVRFGHNAQFLVSTSMDRSIRFYNPPANADS